MEEIREIQNQKCTKSVGTDGQNSTANIQNSTCRHSGDVDYWRRVGQLADRR